MDSSKRTLKQVLTSSPSFVVNLPKKGLVILFQGYRTLFSPLFPPSCRFIPSCSEYGIEAVMKYGAVRGGIMTCWRILRCHPFSRGGYDPVK